MSEPSPPPAPPVASRRPTVLERHGDRRVDDWYWLRERDDPEVLAHLRAENEYAAAVLAPTEPLRARLFDEIAGRVQQSDTSAPVPHGPHEYYQRTVEGAQYPVHCRRPRRGGEEQVLLDENAAAEGHDFFALAGLSVSPDHRVLAYATDTAGDERFTLRFRDLTNGRDLPDTVPDTYYGLAWADDCRTVLYVRPDRSMRPWQVWRHRLGDDPTHDLLRYQEDDERFYVSVGRTRSGRYLLVETASKMASESHVVAAADPDGPLRVVEPRRQGHEYTVEHHVDDDHDRFLLVSNADGPNFALYATPVDAPGREHWTEVVAHRPDVRIEGVDAFASHLVVSERADGLQRLRVLPVDGGDGHVVETPDELGTVRVGANREYDARVLRHVHSSLVLPPADLDWDVDARTSTLVKRQPVLGGYEPERFVSERLWATAPDGTRVPMSVVRGRDVPLDGSAPALLSGYGSYEASTDPRFSPLRLGLLERGFVWAIAHVRGGGEMGRAWYEQGRLLHKRNTFTDFVACADHLVAEGYTRPERLAIRGRSAGGLLMGAVTNLRPDLCRVVVAEVPFVDVLTTMLDASIPLTVTEWEEWGDPSDPDTYAYLRSYSPYDNVVPAAYPDVLATGGLHDSRVQYWEPAKWVQRLRASATNDPLVVLRTELGAGHFGPSGRYETWREEAVVLAFVLDRLGVPG